MYIYRHAAVTKAKKSNFTADWDFGNMLTNNGSGHF